MRKTLLLVVLLFLAIVAGAFLLYADRALASPLSVYTPYGDASQLRIFGPQPQLLFYDTNTPTLGVLPPGVMSDCSVITPGNEQCGMTFYVIDAGTRVPWLQLIPGGGIGLGTLIYGSANVGAHIFSSTPGLADGGTVFPGKSIGRGELATVTGFQTSRPTTGACAAGGCNVTVTWSEAFADTNYTTLCTAFDGTAGNETGLYVERVSATTTTTATVKVANLGGGAITGTVHCLALHD